MKNIGLKKMKNNTIKIINQFYQISAEEADLIEHFIIEEWVTPKVEKELTLDEEDVARIMLINELKKDFGVNDEAIPIILHLIDELNHLHINLKIKSVT